MSELLTSFRRPGFRKQGGERGAALIEFTLLLPLFLLIIFGGLTAGIAYSHKAEVIHGVRDGARYGATVPAQQCDNTSVCGGRNWAELVRAVTAERSDGALAAAQICVALVTDADGKVYPRTGGVYSTGTNSTFPTPGCFDDGGADTGLRVHVAAVLPGNKINLIVASPSFTINSRATAHYEQ